MSEKLEEFRKWYDSKDAEEKKEIVLILDYVLNYKTHYREESILKEIFTLSLISDLKDLNIIHEKSENIPLRSGSMSIITHEVPEEIENDVKVFLKDEIVNFLKEDVVKNNLSEFIRQNIDKLRDLEAIKEGSSWEVEDKTLLYRLTKLGVLYLSRYYSWGGAEYNSFSFREFPFNGEKLLSKAILQAIEEDISELDEVERWIAFLKLNGIEDEFIQENFFIFPPSLINKVFKEDNRIRKINEVVNFISFHLTEYYKKMIMHFCKEILSEGIYELPAFLSLVYLHTEESEFSYIIRKDHAVNFNKSHIEFLKQRGLVLESKDSYIIPKAAFEEIREHIIGYTSVKTFRGKLEAEDFIRRLFSSAKESIWILDNYIIASESKIETLRNLIVSSISPSIEIRIITSYTIDKKIREFVDELKSKNYDIVIKVLEGYGNKRLFHDRYVIIDKRKVWHFGPTLTDAGKKPLEMAFKVPKDQVEGIVFMFEGIFNKPPEELKEFGYNVEIYD